MNQPIKRKHAHIEPSVRDKYNGWSSNQVSAAKSTKETYGVKNVTAEDVTLVNGCVHARTVVTDKREAETLGTVWRAAHASQSVADGKAGNLCVVDWIEQPTTSRGVTRSHQDQSLYMLRTEPRQHWSIDDASVTVK